MSEENAITLSFQDRFTRAQISNKTRGDIYSILGSLLDNGALLGDSLDMLYAIYSDEGRKPTQPAAIMLNEVRAMVVDGKTFGQAIAKWVSPEESSLIAAGEKSGNLRRAFTDALYLISVRGRIWGAVGSGVVYPIILAGALVVMLKIIAYKVIPALAKTSPATSWQGAGHVTYLMSYDVQHYGLATLILTCLLVVAIVVSMPFLTGTPRYYLDKFPPWSVYRRINGGLFMLSMAVLISSGVKQAEALELLVKNATPYLRERIEAVIYGTTRGLFFGDALRDAEYDFPDKRTVLLLTILDKLDGFDVALRRFADDELGRVQEQVEATMKVFYVVMLALMGLITAIITLGSFSIQNSIGNM